MWWVWGFQGWSGKDRTSWQSCTAQALLGGTWTGLQERESVSEQETFQKQCVCVCVWVWVWGVGGWGWSLQRRGREHGKSQGRGDSMRADTWWHDVSAESGDFWVREPQRAAVIWGLLELWWFALSMASRCGVQFAGYAKQTSCKMVENMLMWATLKRIWIWGWQALS